MSLRCLVIVGLFFAARAAVVKSRNIPVEIVYDKTNPIYYGNRNLDAKIQLSSDELLKLKLSDDIINAPEESISAQISEVINEAERAKENEEVQSSEGIKNLEEKVQLSSQETAQVQLVPQESAPAQVVLQEPAPAQVVPQEPAPAQVVPQEPAQVQLSPQEPAQVQFVAAEDSEKSADLGLKQAPTQAPASDNNILLSLLKKAEETAYSGVYTLKNNAEQASQSIANVSNGEIWEKLNQTLDKFFKDQYRNVNLKDDNANTNPNENNNQNNQINEFWQSFVTNFQNTVNNFMGNNFQQNNEKPSGSEDEQGGSTGGSNNQNPVQSFFSSFSTGLSNIVNNINNLNNQNAPNGTSGDTGEGSNGGNIFNNVVSSIQQFFSGGQGNNPIQGIGSNQSDTGVQPPANQNFFQGAINQFQGVINNFRPSTQAPTQAPVQGDEGTSTTQASNLFGNINQAFQNFSGNPLGQLPGQGGGSGGQGGFPDPQAIGSQISNQIGQFTGGQGGQGGSKPFDPQTIGSQIGNQIGQFAGGQGGSGGQGSNPLNPQAIGSQIGSQLGQFGQGGSNGSNPLDPQAIGTQIGNQIGQFGQGGGNPLQSIQNAISGGSSGAASSTEASKTQKSENVEAAPSVEVKLEEKKPAATLKNE